MIYVVVYYHINITRSSLRGCLRWNGTRWAPINGEPSTVQRCTCTRDEPCLPLTFHPRPTKQINNPAVMWDHIWASTYLTISFHHFSSFSIHSITSERAKESMPIIAMCWHMCLIKSRRSRNIRIIIAHSKSIEHKRSVTLKYYHSCALVSTNVAAKPKRVTSEHLPPKTCLQHYKTLYILVLALPNLPPSSRPTTDYVF